MLDYESRLKDAQEYHAQGLRQVANTPPPAGQKYPPGTPVWIAEDLGPLMEHFPCGVWATVDYTYAHAFGGSNVDIYQVTIPERGSVAWYYESQLSLEGPKDSIPLEREAVQAALAGLLRSRNFLGHQLAHAEGLVSDEDLECMADEYLKPVQIEPDKLVAFTEVLVSLLGTQVDSDVVAAAFGVDTKDAELALSRVAKKIATHEPLANT